MEIAIIRIDSIGNYNEIQFRNRYETLLSARKVKRLINYTSYLMYTRLKSARNISKLHKENILKDAEIRSDFLS